MVMVMDRDRDRVMVRDRLRDDTYVLRGMALIDVVRDGVFLELLIELVLFLRV